MRHAFIVGTLAAVISVGTGFSLSRVHAQQPQTRSDSNVVGTSMVGTTAKGSPLGTIDLPRGVKADAQALGAGRYTVRLTGESLDPALGQTPDREQWVEFVRDGRVVGRAVASVVPADQIREVGKAAPPSPSRPRVELLRGNEYVRVWINKDGTNYLIHLPTSGS